MRSNGTGFFDQALDLPPLDWWTVLPYALILLLLVLFVFGYLRGRDGKRPRAELPQPGEGFCSTVPASNDPQLQPGRRRAAGE